jgi:Caspase domain
VAQLPQLDGTQVVLIGASRYASPSLPDLASVSDNIAALAGLLSSSEILGVVESQLTVIHEPASPRAVDEAVRSAASAATDTLIVYFAGHGLIEGHTGELHLALGDSDPSAAHSTAVPYGWIRNAVLRGPPRRVVILDCCFSGRALNTMGDSDQMLSAATEVEGTAVLTAAHENRAALAQPGEPYTAFTGELLSVLEEGIDGVGPVISLRALFGRMEHVLRAKGRPVPQCAFRNTADEIGFRNQAWKEPHKPEPPVKQLSYRAGPRPGSAPSVPENIFFDCIGQQAAQSADLLARFTQTLVGDRCQVFARITNLGMLSKRSLLVPVVNSEYLISEKVFGGIGQLLMDRTSGRLPLVVPVILEECPWQDTVLGVFKSLPRGDGHFGASLNGTAVAAKAARDLLDIYADAV